MNTPFKMLIGWNAISIVKNIEMELKLIILVLKCSKKNDGSSW